MDKTILLIIALVSFLLAGLLSNIFGRREITNNKIGCLSWTAAVGTLIYLTLSP